MRNRRNIRESELPTTSILHKEKGIPKSVLIEILKTQSCMQLTKHSVLKET